MKIATCCAHDHHATLSHPALLRCAGNIDLNPAFSRPSLIIYPQTGEGSPLQGSLRVSGPVSRILSRAAIHLGSASPQTSSGQPGGVGRAALQHLPIRPCTGWGLPGRRVATTPVRSYRTISPLQPVLYGSRRAVYFLSLIHISEPTRLRRISYAVFCLKKKKTNYKYISTLQS